MADHGEQAGWSGMIDRKGEPLVAVACQSDVRTVTLSLGNCPRAGDQAGRLFMPDTLRLEWTNGFLSGCEVSGRVLRADGASHLDDRRTALNWHNGQVGITPEAPDWVLSLILRHRPE